MQFTEALFAETGREEDDAILYTDSGKPGGWFGIEISLEELSYLAVADLGGNGVPAIGQDLDGDELNLGGRGLSIVAELSLTVGVHGSPALGHTVWSVLDLTEKEMTEQPALLVC